MQNPLLLSGPSGVGKSYLAKHLARNYACSRIVPTTTRPQRPGEVDGKDYYFVCEAEYLRRLAAGEMFMSNEFFNARYGFERHAVDTIVGQGRIPLSEIYTPKLRQFTAAYPASQAIFLFPESEDLLKLRMAIRGDTEEQIAYRLQEGREEIAFYRDQAKNLYVAEYVIGTENFRAITLDLVSRFGIRAEGSIYNEKEY